ncbi:MAG: hypothetical protein IJN98_06610 [Alistipes sp.]|nr:hypothetical protein [Alistipes sp.]
MFHNLRTGTPLYVLDKTTPQVVIYDVVNVSAIRTKMDATTQAMWPPRTTNVVDITVKNESQNVTFREVPADLTVFDYGETGVVMSENREAILAEIENFKSASQRALSEVERHRKNVELCDSMLMALNPKAKEEAERAKEFSTIKGEVAEIKRMMEEMFKTMKPKND